MLLIFLVYAYSNLLLYTNYLNESILLCLIMTLLLYIFIFNFIFNSAFDYAIIRMCEEVKNRFIGLLLFTVIMLFINFIIKGSLMFLTYNFLIKLVKFLVYFI